MLESVQASLKAKRLPCRRAISAYEMLFREAEMATGCPPETETRQRLPSMRFREEAKTISRLSAVQVIPSIRRASEVSCRACPPDAGMTKSSCAEPVNSRWNATHFPSGEKAGRESTP